VNEMPCEYCGRDTPLDEFCSAVCEVSHLQQKLKDAEEENERVRLICPETLERYNDELCGEVEALRQQLAECERERNLYLEEMHHYQQQLYSVTKDAERYRWLRSIGHEQISAFGHYAEDSLDAAIDANLAKVGAGKGEQA
jgi:chromosome segregation ATPase